MGLDLQKKSDEELMNLVTNENQWYVRHAKRILRERGKLAIDGGVVIGGAANADAPQGKFIESTETNPALRSDGTPRDRRNLASQLTAVPPAGRMSTFSGLFQHEEDLRDPVLPFLYWYAFEPFVAESPASALSIAKESKLASYLLPLTARRIGSLRTPEALNTLVVELTNDSKPQSHMAVLNGLLDGLKGNANATLPPLWPNAYAELAKSPNAEVKAKALAVAVAFRDPAAIQTMFEKAGDTKAPVNERLTALDAVLDAGHNRTGGLLKQLINEPAMRAAAIRGMARWQDDGIPAAILKAYPNLPPAEKRDAVNTLASRSAYAKELLAAVGAKVLPASDIPAETVRQLRNLSDPAIATKIGEVWGTFRETSADRKRIISDWTKKLNVPYQGGADLAHGRAVYAKVCQQCHTLYGVGSKVGPEITGSNRADLAYLLENIFDPSAVIPKEYAATKIDLADGRVVTGIVKGDNGAVLTVATATETLTIPKKDVEKQSPSDLSMMPDDLTKPLSEVELRNLVAYLRHNQQVPMKATAENVKEFFNGKDLTGWDMDPVATELKVYSVENGEIVGKSEKGLKKNTFLTSTLEVSDFTLSLKMKLTPNTENSGIQIRSVRIDGGEMRGPQCDAGKGWWGKLYEESGRGLLWKEDGDKHVKPGEWNEYKIEAKGNTIRTWVNGQPCVNLTDDKLARKGLIGLQVHSGGPIEVRFKDLKLELMNP